MHSHFPPKLGGGGGGASYNLKNMVLSDGEKVGIFFSKGNSQEDAFDRRKQPQREGLRATQEE